MECTIEKISEGIVSTTETVEKTVYKGNRICHSEHSEESVHLSQVKILHSATLHSE